MQNLNPSPNGQSETYDVLIVGAGPIGLACGVEAVKQGLSYLVLEKGCLVNSLYNYPKGMTFFSTSEKLEIGGAPFVSHGHKPTRAESLEYYRRVADQWRLDIRYYEAVENVKQVGDGPIYEVKTSKGAYRAKAVILATGFYGKPNLMGVPGEDLPHVKHYYDEPHPYIGQKVTVVGAANSAADVALELYRKGAEVSMVVRQAELNPRLKYWVRPDIENRIKEGSIQARFKTTIKEIKVGSVLLETPEGEVEQPADWVLAMTGYKPDYPFLERIGVKVQEDGLLTPCHHPETYETNLENVYLAGVVCGGMKTNKWFIENSREHAEVVLRQVAERKAAIV